jgi:ubiquinone/menaquinone biosynthesis C-methylase UbiE
MFRPDTIGSVIIFAMAHNRRLLIAAAGGVAGVAAWWRRHPSPCPYGQRFWVEAPHPFITRRRLLSILAPTAGERLLELGPGTGYYTLPVARALDGGRLRIADIQQRMLDHTMRRARKAGLGNIESTRCDAQSLPYENDSFDGAFTVTTLGEVPDPDRALQELARVLKPSGRLVVGEVIGDPHMVTFGSLRERAARAGLRIERRLGGPFAYFALLRR